MNQHYPETAFQTYDLALATALVTAGFRQVELDRTDPRKVAFVFDKVDGIDEAVEQFWSDRQRVNPKAYFDTLKHLKSQIYSR